MRLFDSQLEHNFINSLFLKIKNTKDTVDTKTIEKYFNVFKKESKILYKKFRFSRFKCRFV